MIFVHKGWRLLETAAKRWDAVDLFFELKHHVEMIIAFDIMHTAGKRYVHVLTLKRPGEIPPHRMKLVLI